MPDAACSASGYHRSWNLHLWPGSTRALMPSQLSWKRCISRLGFTTCSSAKKFPPVHHPNLQAHAAAPVDKSIAKRWPPAEWNPCFPPPAASASNSHADDDGRQHISHQQHLQQHHSLSNHVKSLSSFLLTTLHQPFINHSTTKHQPSFDYEPTP